MPSRLPLPTARRVAAAWLVAVLVVLGANPAWAQYGGGPNLFVDPALIEICDTADRPTIDAFGNLFPPASTVTLTVDGIPGVLGTTTTAANGIFRFDDLVVPPEFTPGNDYTVRASSGGASATFVVTVVADQSETCGGSTGSVTSTSTTTTTSVPDGSSPSTTVTGAPPPGETSGTDLAITGLTGLELTVQIGVTLIGLGVVFALLARRSRAEPT